MEGVYLTWLISALAIGLLLMPLVKPPWTKITLSGFVDFLRRYWLHIGMVLIIYNSKDFLDEIDRVIMANTGLDMTPWIYAIEGDMALWMQQTFESEWLTIFFTHFYVVGFMVICYVSIFYFAYFDDRWMADRICLTIFFVYFLAIPFYLFFNVRVTGDHIPGMETLGYDLTTEITNWFARIDPFTNGMPSLHIGFPFAVWLCLLRNDEDGRWLVYRRLVFAYTVLTAFCILYLGIHWILDIIGGMVVAAIAVYLSDRYSGPIWNIFDERTINARLVTVLTNPKHAFSMVKESTKKLASNFSRPTSKETGAILTAVIIIVAGIITWDLTHQSLPAGGVDTPVDVAAADGWLVTLDNSSDMGALLVVHDLSDVQEEIEVRQPILDSNSSFSVRDDILAMANSTKLFIVNLETPSQTILELDVNNPIEVSLVSNSIVAVFDLSGLTYWNYDGVEVDGPNAPIDDTIILFESSEDEVAMVFASQPSTVHIGLFGAEGLISIPINASVDEIVEQELISAERNIDIENASIIDLDFNIGKMAATIDVNATTRIVLLDRTTGDSQIVSNPIFAAQDPYLDHGVLMWSSYQHIDPANASSKVKDREIYILNLTSNIVDPLTADNVDQWSPMVLEEHYVYCQQNADGSISVEVQEREATLKPYTSSILQFGVVISVVLVFINLTQRQFESRKSISHHDSEL